MAGFLILMRYYNSLMKRFFTLCTTFIILFIFSAKIIFAQNIPDSLAQYKKIAAGAEYKRSPLYQWLWGKNNRKEWITPVTFPVLKLDTAKGGMISYEEGGSHQTKSLHIKFAGDKQYALRSVDKSLSPIIPEIFKHTFIEHIVDDEISMSHPYGALAVPVMAESAHLLHTNPQYYYLPAQAALDTLNKKYAGQVYLLEQRPKGDWSDAPNLGGFDKFISSEKLLEKIYDDNDHHVDELAFAKLRLFDMLIGDWDRHWDQWKWGAVDKGGQKIYIPVPTDRDQAFVKFDGILVKALKAAAGMKYLQSFDYTIADIKSLYTEKRMLDRFLTNQVTLSQWQILAKELQQSITDSIITASVKQMPPEIFAISGNEIIAKLKSRRRLLQKYATEYYYFLAKEVEVVGSKKNELFLVNRLNDKETAVNVYKINKEGEIKNEPFYSRVFKTDETKEIRLFGLSGNDIYSINGKVNNGITIRIIGGDEKDSIIDNSNIKMHVYDAANNVFIKGSKTRLHLSDSTDHTYNYDTYIPDKKGWKPLAGYTYYDPFYIGIGYGVLHHKWRRLPFAYKQDISIKYSITQKSFSVFYTGIFPNAIGKWNLLLNAEYDAIRWINFYGLGNETIRTHFKDVDYNRIQSHELLASIGIERKIGESTIDISGFYKSTKIINNQERYISKIFAPSYPGVFNQYHYAGARLGYTYINLNDLVVPTKGFTFFGNAAYYNNLKQSNTSFGKYSGIVNLYIPLIPKFSLAIRSAAATVTGNPFFYELPYIGGADDLRGYRRERFWGKSTFTNSNELRFITDFKSYIMNGKLGFSIFYDQGRVWQPAEKSNTWHTDYGAGLLLAPFNKFLVKVAYGISEESNVIQLQLIKSF